MDGMNIANVCVMTILGRRHDLHEEVEVDVFFLTSQECCLY